MKIEAIQGYNPEGYTLHGHCCEEVTGRMEKLHNKELHNLGH
jgi:hypothetical protein